MIRDEACALMNSSTEKPNTLKPIATLKLIRAQEQSSHFNWLQRPLGKSQYKQTHSSPFVQVQTAIFCFHSFNLGLKKKQLR